MSLDLVDGICTRAICRRTDAQTLTHSLTRLCLSSHTFFVFSPSLVTTDWSMITMTTIGYGDISAEDTISRVVLIVYLPTAVAALADTLTQLTQISTAKMLIETDFTEQADDLLLGEAGGANPNPEETLTELSFLISVLKDNDLIDDMSVQAIRLQFAQLVRHDTWTSDPTNRVLDDRIVFLEMKAQGRIAQSGKANAPATTEKGKNIEYVDLKAADGGFKWLESYWLPRVFDGKSHGEQVRLHVPPAPGKAPSGAAPTKTMKDPETGGKKSYQQLKDSNGHPNKGGAYFGDGAASSVEGSTFGCQRRRRGRSARPLRITIAIWACGCCSARSRYISCGRSCRMSSRSTFSAAMPASWWTNRSQTGGRCWRCRR